jgi:hypothetical protein
MRNILILAAALFSTSALAVDVDFSAVITDQDGMPVIDCAGSPKDCEGKPPLTLGKVAMRALTASFEDERALTGEEKLKRGDLALRAYKSERSMQMTAEEVALVKRLIAKGYGPLIVVRTWPLLDPASK